MGSTPTRRATTPQTPIKRDFESIKRVKNTTFLQLYKQYINTNLNYLQKINNIYYFVIKINKKVIKQSLKSNNLIFCNIQKLKILKYLTEELKLELNINPTLTIHFIEDDDDDLESLNKIKQKLSEVTAEEVANGNIKTLKINDSKSISLSEAIEKFLDYKINVEKVRPATIITYQSAFSYLYLFTTGETNIKLLSKKFFNDLQSNLKKIPRDYLKSSKRRDIEDILNENTQDKKLLDNATINKHFIVYKTLYDFLIRNDFIQNNMVDIKLLKEDSDNQREEFEFRELNDLFNLKTTNKNSIDSDEECQNIFKFAYLTGMRFGEIMNLKIDDIEEIGSHRVIDIKEGKNKTSIRLIPTNLDIDKILYDQINKSKNGFIFLDYEKDEEIRKNPKGNILGKRLNRKINNYLISQDKDKSIKSFHSFRKNFSQTLYLERFQLKEIVISKLMGHSVELNITRSIYNRNKVERDALIYAMSCMKLDDIKDLAEEELFFIKEINKEQTLEQKKEKMLESLNKNISIV